MRTGLRLATVVGAATLVAMAGAFGSVVAAPVYVPVQTPTASSAHDAALADAARSGGPALTVGTTQIPGGIALPAGMRLLGPAITGHSPGDLHRWEMTLDLGDVPGSEALDSLAASLTALGFEVRQGRHDVFAARERANRWEIVVLLVETRGTGEDARDVLGLAIGSRPA
jgi:hypothetical protein